MKNIKAQIEMMGLVMVVILLIFGLLIYVRIQVNNAAKEADDVDDTFMVDMSSKVLKTMLHTTSDCNYLDGRQLISDLASNNNNEGTGVQCTYRNLINCDGSTSEEVLFGITRPPPTLTSGMVHEILIQSLTEEAKLNYHLKINLKDGCTIYESEDLCVDAKNSYQGEFVFDSDKGKVVATLTVC